VSACVCVCVVSCSAGRRTDGDLWVLAIDGMDQSKTRLPHEKRSSHDTDSLDGLPLHVVSVVVYGGFTPLIGLINDPSVTKNSCLTVTNIHRAIELQWTASVEASASKKIVRWPSRLHITFDNAVGENINSNVFYYLAALVHHGVFKRVTVGTLCVGHTHNINDQIFSVWSKYLNVNNVATLADLLDKFSTNYTGHMHDSPAEAALLQAMIEEKALLVEAKAVVQAAELAAVVEEAKRAEPARAAKMREEMKFLAAMNVTAHERAEQMKRLRRDLADERRATRAFKGPRMFGDITSLGAHPHMEMVEHNVDAGGWLRRGKARKFDLTGLGQYHVFRIDKNMDGCTYLTRKFLSNSDVTYADAGNNQAHRFDVDGAFYRDQLLLFEKEEYIDFDPIALPFNVVDTASIMKKVDMMHSMKGINDAQAKTYTDMCAGFHAKVIEQGLECKVCKAQVKTLADIGVIHRMQNNPSEDEFTAYRKKVKDRVDAQNVLNLHLNEPDAGDRHPSKVMLGWWTNWLTRVKKIEAHYRSKGVACLEDEDEFENGLYAPPADQTAEELKAFERIEVAQMAAYGPPRCGDFALIRSSRVKSQAPFWLAKVLLYDSPSDELLAEDARRADEKKRPAPTPSPPVNADDQDANVVKWMNEKGQKRAPKKSKGGMRTVSDAAKVDTFMHTHVKLQWWVHNAACNRAALKHLESDATSPDGQSAPKKRNKAAGAKSAAKAKVKSAPSSKSKPTASKRKTKSSSASASLESNASKSKSAANDASMQMFDDEAPLSFLQTMPSCSPVCPSTPLPSQSSRSHLGRSARNARSIIESPAAAQHPERDEEYQEEEEERGDAANIEHSDREVDMTHGAAAPASTSAHSLHLASTPFRISKSAVGAVIQSMLLGAHLESDFSSAPAAGASSASPSEVGEPECSIPIPLTEADINVFKENSYFENAKCTDAQWVSVEQLIYWGNQDAIMIGMGAKQQKKISAPAWRMLLTDLMQGAGGSEGAAALHSRMSIVSFDGVTHENKATSSAWQSLEEKTKALGRKATPEWAAEYRRSLLAITKLHDAQWIAEH
jgi:hypothetical protein